MPPRQFDGSRVRAVRRGKDLGQKELAAEVGVSGPTVARWESGQDFPKGEKLPAIAAALSQPLDALFPHDGPPDLQLLRCDAGLSVAQAAAILGTSRVPVSNAESGRRRLSDAYVQPLAEAYGVTEAELLAAQDCSFGLRPRTSRDDQASAPRTIGEKINYLLQHGYVGQEAPSDEEIARVVNDHAGVTAVTTDDIVDLRTGVTTEASDVVRAGLAEALQVDAALFQDDAEVNPAARELLEAIRFLGSIHRGQILGLAARGNSGGLSAEMMATINDLVGELKHKLPEVPDGE
ncbi:helix-turn-helix domain-containing protein [Streptomyces sp. MBT56]|uniref:helix-turn-helix domain-containing protein n=1 Tax=unclassified Streptomyces TaxID=2593676 RepID=UPI00190BEB56|nr:MULTISPECIES: helix-turn-helix transcriptional regulator [unclassified Streptomyces]MBK3534756.1 helix-turn-helix domain-containing protein [Streptomyces sp. MBT67]MBK3560352.1 helix-turn-helix domain-containing protein [Streptomyces sp. MBT56]MBK3600017.1 helix-turn-helix domain-containing protein [Streptomyces sp. MBT54]MBK3613272.1 helix-turn-helix domain-containing protein [Streptomyces sp. MBT98]